VAEFRGVEMPRLLAWLDGEDRDRWLQVRRYVHPAPQPPVLIQNNRVVRRNYDWPAADPAKMSDAQKAWHAYLLWPKHVRQLLQAEGPDPEDRWDSLANRTRLA